MVHEHGTNWSLGQKELGMSYANSWAKVQVAEPLTWSNSPANLY